MEIKVELLVRIEGNKIRVEENSADCSHHPPIKDVVLTKFYVFFLSYYVQYTLQYDKLFLFFYLLNILKYLKGKKSAL